jgi:predicted TIM-barrel fold metal-dependent hydrolase
MTALKQVVGLDQIVVGTDFPYSTMVDHIVGLAASETFDAQELERVYRGNSERFLPQGGSATA